MAPKGQKRKVVRKEVSDKDLEDLSTKAEMQKKEKRWREWKDVEEAEEVECVEEKVEKEVEEEVEEEMEEEVKENRQSSRSSKPVQKFDFGNNHLLKSVKQSNYARKIKEKINHRESQSKYEMKLKLAQLAKKVKEQKTVIVEQVKDIKTKDKCLVRKDKTIEKLKK